MTCRTLQYETPILYVLAPPTAPAWEAYIDTRKTWSGRIPIKEVLGKGDMLLDSRDWWFNRLGIGGSPQGYACRQTSGV
jgi:hypothetical protein